MSFVVIAFQVIVGISILNVWLLQKRKSTRWRGGNATTIVEEFHEYGLSTEICYIVGFIKVTLAVLLIASIWYPVLKQPAAFGLAILLLGSMVMHIKIKDPLLKSFPAALFFAMCLFIALA